MYRSLGFKGLIMYTVHLCNIRSFISSILLYTVMHVIPKYTVVPFDFCSVVACSYSLTLSFHSPNF